MPCSGRQRRLQNNINARGLCSDKRQLILLRFRSVNSDQERHPFVCFVPFQTTVELVSLKRTNRPLLQWLKHVRFPPWDVLLRSNCGELMQLCASACVAPLPGKAVGATRTREAGARLRERAGQSLQPMSHGKGSRSCTKGDLVLTQ